MDDTRGWDHDKDRYSEGVNDGKAAERARWENAIAYIRQTNGHAAVRGAMMFLEQAYAEQRKPEEGG